MENIKELYLSKLGNSSRFSYGEKYDVKASYIYDRINECEDISKLEPVGLIVNEDEIDNKHTEVLKHVMNHLQFSESGDPNLNIPDSDTFNINYKTIPVIVDVTKEDIAEGNNCMECKTSYLAQDLCPVCGNEGTDDEPPIYLEKILKSDAYRIQRFSEYMLKNDIEEISKIHPDYDYKSDFVLWLTIDLYERFINENVYGSINIIKKDGSTIPIDTVIRKPYPNKSYYQISKKVKVGSSWKRGLGIPLIFKSLEEINEIERFVIKWEVHTKIKDDDLLIETVIVNHPFSLIKYCNDDRKRIIPVKIKDYLEDSLIKLNSIKITKDYSEEFARSCVLEDDFDVEELESQDAIYTKIHNIINDAIYEGEITSSEELMSLKPNLDSIKKTIKNNNLSNNVFWKITFGMRYIRANLNYHK